MSYTKKQIADALDYAVLSPLATVEDIWLGCAFANKHKLKSICVASVNVKWAASLHDNVCSVIGFPYGNVEPYAKLIEARCAIERGAKELDVVLNYGRYLGGDQTIINQELGYICEYAAKSRVRVKAILETCHYTPQQITEACKRCVDSGVSWVKTSTGFAPGGATVAAVTVMLDAVGDQCEVKASGGIHRYEDAKQFLNLGCTRLGASRYRELLPPRVYQGNAMELSKER